MELELRSEEQTRSGAREALQTAIGGAVDLSLLGGSRSKYAPFLESLEGTDSGWR